MLGKMTCAKGLRTKAAESVPDNLTSSTKRARPLSSSGSSRRSTLASTLRRLFPGAGAGGSVMSVEGRGRSRTGSDLKLGLPGRKLRGIAPGRPSADEALGQISAGHVEMSEHPSKLAGREQPRNGLAERAQHALLVIMHRAAMGVGAYRPNLCIRVGRRCDF